jgi:hypothetical protein
LTIGSCQFAEDKGAEFLVLGAGKAFIKPVISKTEDHIVK